MDIVIITNTCSKCPTFAPTHALRRLRHSLIALSMTMWFTAFHKAGKFKVCSWLYLPIITTELKWFSDSKCFICIISQICDKFELLNSER